MKTFSISMVEFFKNNRPAEQWFNKKGASEMKIRYVYSEADKKMLTRYENVLREFSEALRAEALKFYPKDHFGPHILQNTHRQHLVSKIKAFKASRSPVQMIIED